MDEQTWLILENKVRVLIKDLIDPTLRRVMEHKDQISSLENKQELTAAMLGDTNISLTKLRNRLTLLDDYSKKLMEFDATLKLMETKFDKDREEIINHLGEFQMKLISFDEVLSKISNRQDVQKIDIQKLAHDHLMMKTNFEETIKMHREDSIKKFEAIEDDIRKIEEFDKESEFMIKKIKEDIQNLSLESKNNERMINDLNQLIAKIKKNLSIYKKDNYDKIEKIRTNISKNSADLMKISKDINVHLSGEFLVKLDLRTIETLYGVSNDLKQKKSVADWAIKKFEEIDSGKLPEDIKECFEKNKKYTEEIIQIPLPPEPVHYSRKKKKYSSSSDSEDSEIESSNTEQSQESIIRQGYYNSNQKIYEDGLRRSSQDRQSSYTESVRTSQNYSSVNNSYAESINKSITLADKQRTIEEPIKQNQVASIKTSYPNTPRTSTAFTRPIEILRNQENPLNALNKSIDYSINTPKPSNEPKTNYQEPINISKRKKSKKLRKEIREIAPQIIMPDLSGIEQKIEEQKVEYQSLIEASKTEILSIISSNQADYTKDRITDAENLKVLLKSLEDTTATQFNKIVQDNEQKSADLVLHTKDLEFKFLQAINDYNLMATQRKRDLSDISAEFRQINTSIENISNILTSTTISIDSMKSSIDNLIDFSIISSVLTTQDEIDRESIFLMGYKEPKAKFSGTPRSSASQTPRNVVNIDKTCLSCTGQSSIVLSAFKMACLTYTPSPVIFRQQLFTRKELIETQSKILSGLRNENKKPVLGGILEEIKQSRSKTCQTSSPRRRRPLSVPGSSLDMTSPSDITSPESIELPMLSKRTQNS
ncbi:unnamed protein product [Blepharisma stoltei]|uniref:Uncharacterized protein n=1 Tax=Blepharisma stoltei TaxID=1481888 RepID=A0AAU9KH68_9CILI|nr:unnamed protein product [Blepharisma stoltei]